MGLFGVTCPNCGKDDIKEVKAKNSILKRALKSRITLIGRKKETADERPTYVCNDCGHTWPKE